MKYLLLLLAVLLAGYNQPVTKEPVIIAFHADWCRVCKRMYPVWRSLDNVQWVNVDNSALDEKYKVSVVPSTVIIKEGQVILISGVVRRDQIDQYLR